jgi:8-oxo-dGTP diphosphatase
MPTPTHPGAPTLGWSGFAACIQDNTIPVYALGGMCPEDLPKARQFGAHGVAMLRGAWN